LFERFEMKSFAALLLLSSIASAGERPASAPPVDERLTGIESRMKTLETRVNLVERDMDRLTGKTSTTPGYEIQRGPEVEATPNCPCSKGGKCICGNDCQCPLCLEHLTNVEVVSLYAAHEAEISKIWEGLGDKEDATMRKAVEVWIKQQHCKNQGVESQPKVTVLGFFTRSCIHCPGAKTDCAGLNIDWRDANMDPRADEYHVEAYPAVILLDENGKKIGHHEGRTGLANKVREWLAAPAYESKPAVKESRIEKPTQTVDGDASDAHGYSWSQVSGMNRSQLKSAHNRSHGGPAVVAKNYPVRRQAVRYVQPMQYRPTMYYRPSYGSCPNCR
jgi:hypothetical protein